MKVIQKMLSLVSLKFAPFSTKELNGNKSGYLYSRKGKIECQFDFYYIEHGLVYSVNYLYFNDRHHHDSLKRIVSITNLNEMSSPKEYFVLTQHFKLHPDYGTYWDVVKAWIENNDLLFYEDINIDDLPNRPARGTEQNNRLMWDSSAFEGRLQIGSGAAQFLTSTPTLI